MRRPPFFFALGTHLPTRHTPLTDIGGEAISGCCRALVRLEVMSGSAEAASASATKPAPSRIQRGLPSGNTMLPAAHSNTHTKKKKLAAGLKPGQEVWLDVSVFFSLSHFAPACLGRQPRCASCLRVASWPDRRRLPQGAKGRMCCSSPVEFSLVWQYMQYQKTGLLASVERKLETHPHVCAQASFFNEQLAAPSCAAFDRVPFFSSRAAQTRRCNRSPPLSCPSRHSYIYFFETGTTVPS